jgi:DNA-binding LacI/PurR family transcriptional regulator
MKFEAVTIKDIAIALGLSTSTVSRALRDSYEISPATKKIVLEYAEQINYRPNPIALSLKEKRSHSIGVIVCEIANSFFSQAINGIESIAYSKGYNVIISQSHESYDREVIDLNYLASRSIDGLLISVSAETENFSHIQSLHDRGFPIVFFDRAVESINTHKVIVDNTKGAFDATEHLIKTGYIHIANLAGSPHLSITKDRIKGYRKAIETNGLHYEEAYTQYCLHGGMVYEEVEKALDNMMALPNKPDAIVASADKLTTNCIRYFKSKNIRVPEDVALIGFSNLDIADLLSPSLSVVRQPAFAMGQIATELLLKMIESKRAVSNYENRVLPLEIMVRESSTPLK